MRPEMFAQLPGWLESFRLEDTPDRWIAAGVIFAVVLIVAYIARSVVANRVGRLADRTVTVWDDAAVDALRRTRTWFMVALAAFCGSLVLEMPSERWREIIGVMMILVLLLQIALWGHVLFGAAADRYADRQRATDPAAAMTVSALAMIGRLVLYVVILLLALENVGVNVTALVAGLGVGGIAVALAVQNILGDLLASLSIVLDKPFVPGDFISVGTQAGTVQHIGLKTTRVASLSGEELVFSNNDLLQSRVQNFKRMKERRVVFVFRVPNQTPRDILAQLPTILKEIVQSRSNVRFDRAHFKAFEEFALSFEVVYYVLTPAYNDYMDTQQAINLDICEALDRLGVPLPYPTRTVYLENVNPPDANPD